MKWSILAVSGTTFDSDLRPQRDDKRPWPIMDEAAFRKVRLQARHPSLRRSRHSAGQRVSAEPPAPRVGGSEATVANSAAMQGQGSLLGSETPRAWTPM